MAVYRCGCSSCCRSRSKLRLGRTWVRIVDFALLYTMLALGLNIVVGFAGLLDLGYVAFYAVGAYRLCAARFPALRHSSAVLGAAAAGRGRGGRVSA